MQNKEFYLKDDGIRLHAKLDFPAELVTADENDAKCPLVIIIHGFTGHMEERHIVGVAQTLNETGFATLRVDMYGHGKSDGDFADHTLYKWLTNAITVTDYAKNLPFVTDLYLCGHSQGGLATILTAGLFPDVFKAILPLAPGTMIPDIARSGSILGVEFDPEKVPEELTGWEGKVRLRGNYIRAAQTLYVEPAYARYKKPVLLVHADTDETVPYSCSTEAAKQYADAKLVTIPGDTHCFDHHLDQVQKAVKEFMLEMRDR